MSKGIDLIFIEIKKISKELQLSEKNLKFMNIETLYNAQSSLKSTKLKKEIMKEIFENKKNFKILKHLNLPDLITNSNDLYFYESFSHKEKYITEKIVKGDLIFLYLNKSSELKNKIVLIKNEYP